MAKLRLGVAALLTGDALLEVQGIRRALGERGVERMDPHITLVPPFNLPVEEVDEFVGTVGRILGKHAPFPARLGASSTFGDESPVLFLEVDDLEEAFRTLTEQILVYTPLENLRRVYHPHCTLGDGFAPDEIALLIRSLGFYDRSIEVSSIAIMEKPDMPPKSRWRPYVSFELGEHRHLIRGGLELDLFAVSDVPSVFSPRSGPSILAFMGSKMLGRCDTERVSPKVVELCDLVVDDEDMRARGVGRSLWEMALRYLKSLEVSLVIARPSPTQEEFLAKLGFVEAVDPLLGMACYGVMSKLWSFSIL